MLVVPIVISRAARSQFQVLGLLVSVATLFPCSRATAQETKSPALLASLSVAPLDDELTRTRSRLALSPLPERLDPIPLRLTSTERWDRFEEEFGNHETPATPVRYAVAKGVYQLNVVLFTLGSIAQDVGSTLHWKHSDDGWERADFADHPFSPTAPKTLFGKLNESHFRVEFNSDDNQRYAALRWEIPFGN